MYPSPVESLISSLSRFPTIGKRTATRFAFYLLNAPEEEVELLLKNIKELRRSVKLCQLCFRSVTEENELCQVCQSKKRDRSTICVVEKETDLLSIESTKEYNGLYFVLGGTVSPLKKEDFKGVRVKELQERITQPEKFDLPPIKEVIIATNQNTAGEATALYVERVLGKLNINTTRLGKGLSTGSELEYADEDTLLHALKGRK